MSDIFDITPSELEKELNENVFFKRVSQGKVKVDELNKEVLKNAEKKKDFEKIIEVYDKNNQKIKLKLIFTCVIEQTSNIYYMLRCEVLDK